MNENHCKEIKQIRNYYILHFIFYFLLIIFNFLILFEIIWIKKILYYIFFSGSIFTVLYFIFPWFPFSFIMKKKLNIKNILIFRVISLVFCVIAIILGLFFSVILMINIIDSSEFCQECPFNLPIPKIINQDTCTKTICILNNENLNEQYPYEYFCNYNPLTYFDDNIGYYRRNINATYQVTSDKLIICEKYELYNFIIENDIINNYIKACTDNDKDAFYICKRFFEYKQYNVEENFDCPNERYFKILYNTCILNIIMTLVLSFVPWKLEINYFDKIMLRYRANNNRETKKNKNNSTQNSSNIKETKLKDVFKKVPTETIIICNINTLNLPTDSNFDDKKNNNNNIYNRKIIDINHKNDKSTQNKQNNNNNNKKDINEIKVQKDKEKESIKKVGELGKKIESKDPLNSNDLFLIENNINLRKTKKKNINCKSCVDK